MRFRPCIDIHNGKVKQIVGGSLKDQDDQAQENFASAHDADYFAEMYKSDGLLGGHVILLNPPSSEYYEATLGQARKALLAYPGGLQVGGGIRADNGERFLALGASHVIVTSYVFGDGQIRWENLEALKKAVGREHVVVDLSCRRKDGEYYIVTNRWQTFTEVKLTQALLTEISGYCDEFLVHGVDVEGKASGIEEELVRLLSRHKKNVITYAGGIGSLDDLERFRILSEGQIDFTIGSALDLFGGEIPYKEVCRFR